MTRDEHLEWSKERALEYLPQSPDDAFVSMMKDLVEHEELKDHAGIRVGLAMMMAGLLTEPDQVWRWIVGFH